MARRVARARTDADRARAVHAATLRLAALRDLDATVAAVAEEACRLTSATSARCCTVDADGTWWGMHLQDGRRRPLDPVAAARLVAVGAGTDEGLVVARHEVGPVVVAVDGVTDDAAAVLEAFADAAAVVVDKARAIRALHDELRARVEENRQKDELVAAVSHELRTPLAVVLGSLQTLRRVGARVPEGVREELLATAEGGGNRVLRLIEDLLVSASSQHGTLRAMADVVDPVELLRSVAAEACTTGGPACRIDADDHLPTVVTDHDKLRRIVTNLVENARKYAPGSVVELGVTSAGEELVVTVADHGPGIPADDRARVFQPFVQLERAGRPQGGTGLGLHLCRTMIDVLGGRLTLGDRPDGAPGAHFTLHLPIVVPAPEAALGVGGHQ